MILLLLVTSSAFNTMAAAEPEFDSEQIFQLICRLIPILPGCQRKTCIDELGRIYDEGETKTCPDGCNRCTCNEGNLFWTEAWCPPSHQLCKYGDQILEGDETVTCKDGRSKCTCKNGRIEKSKKTSEETKEKDGKYYLVETYDDKKDVAGDYNDDGNCGNQWGRLKR